MDKLAEVTKQWRCSRRDLKVH